MKKFILLLASIFIFLNTKAEAVSQEQACVAYQRADSSWSHGYKVTGYILSGRELNDIARRNSYYSQYNYYSHYFVIPWDNGGYTALEIPFGSRLSTFDEYIRDHENRQWRVKKGWTLCY